MSMGNLNKLALTAQEALQQTMAIASENEASQASPFTMLKALLESTRTTCRYREAHRRRPGPAVPERGRRDSTHAEGSAAPLPWRRAWPGPYQGSSTTR